MVHLIFDYTHMYYKYLFKLEKGILKTLTFDGRDISKIYYSLRDIENARRKHEKAGEEVSIHIAMDSKTKRKEDSEEYKANREKKLTSENYDDIADVAEMLSKVGYNVVKIDGYEADDIVYTIASNIPDGDTGVIYTNDSDVTINVRENVKVELYNSFSGNITVDRDNFVEVMRQKLKSEEFDFNQIMLYKATVGDKSDNVKGIPKFGEKTYDKMIRAMKPYILDSCYFVNEKFTRAFIERAGQLGVLKREQVECALASLGLVAPIEIEDIKDKCSAKFNSTCDTRESVYGVWNMKSLYE